MYIAITRQQMGDNYQGSCGDFVRYLEKENEGKAPEDQEQFFDQTENNIDAERVIADIDANTAKLSKRDPKFYSIMVSPSQAELNHIGNDPEKLKQYTRELMKTYATSFYRDKEVTVKDVLYFAKLERERTYSERDKAVKENQPIANKILDLQHQIRAIREGREHGDMAKLQEKINVLETEAPHKQNGKRIVIGMAKEGHQSHIHIIVSRKDVTNSHSLSPGSKFRTSETTLNGEKVKQGFDRDKFYRAAEKTFDKQFGYRRNFVETYHARNLLDKDPKRFFAALLGLPATEKQAARQLLFKAGVKVQGIPTNKVQLAYKAMMRLKKGIGKAMESGSIGI
ncbi:MobB family relaxase [Flagellimonas aequoris]|uniref:Mobilization protein n=1 Tax=Flagellimonas aequoris TaxID=2306997 RepID=A0A418N5F1_9FLAO|nr:MobB family relaxase [Allomuricauda aequoris]RIV69379.1 mobilization protein [Allomuricauda aequoris]TXK01050.1 mobilization protein [Allomuricauda aequoris]